MLRNLQRQLAPVKRRLVLRRTLAALAAGLVLGGWLALMAGLMALFAGSALAAMGAVAAALGMPLAFAAWPLLRGAGWDEAARAVDRRFHLHNRTATALYLAAHPSGDALESLQLEDAAAQLASKKLRDAVALSIPWQPLASGVLLTLLGLGLAAWGMAMPMTGLIRVAPAIRGGLRQEVAQRQAAPLPLIDQALAARSSQLLASQGAGSATAPAPPMGIGVAERYFDQLPSNAPASGG